MIKLIIDPKQTALEFNLEDYKDEIELSTQKELDQWLETRSVVYLDTETNRTVNYHEPNAIVCRQVGDKETQFVTTLPLPKSIENKTVVAHNAEFDYNMLKQDRLILRRVWCTMNIEKILRTSKFTKDQLKDMQPFKLSHVVQHRLGQDIDKSQQTTFEHGKLTLEQVRYAAKDCEILQDLFIVQFNEIVKENLLVCARLENRYTLAAGDMMYNGVYLDKDKWIQASEVTKKEIKEIIPKMDAYLKEHHRTIYNKYKRKNINQMDLLSALNFEKTFDEEREITFNYNSPIQVKMVLKEMGRLPKDKHGTETTSAKELKKFPLAKRNQWINDFIEYKTLSKLLSSYGVSWLDNINKYTGRIHCSLDQIINTGRTATFAPNLYQMPKKNEYRNCITVEDESKYSIVGGDYSAQEGRIMAFMSGDPAYIEFYNTGDGDSHSFVATKMFSSQYGCDFTVKSTFVEVKNSKLSKQDLLRLSNLMGKDFALTEIAGGYRIDFVHEENGKTTKLDNVWRQNGKILNFFLSFGGSAYTLHMELGIDVKEAQSLIDAFFNAFPALKVFFQKEAQKAIKTGYSISNKVTKRKRWFPEYEEMMIAASYVQKEKVRLGDNTFFTQLKDRKTYLSSQNRKAYKLKGDIERAAQNNPIQGTAADMSKEAMCLVRERLIEDNYLPFMDCPVKIILMPHDEIRTQCTVELEKYTGQLVADAMDDAGQLFVQGISLRPDIDYEKCWKK